jgi:hypothetical protein
MSLQPQNIRPMAPRPAAPRLHLPVRQGGSLYRDERYVSEEVALDSMITENMPDLAIPLAKELYEEVEGHSHVPEGLARITFKAIAIAQSARQYYGDDREGDATYSQIGTLLDKTLQERSYFRNIEDWKAAREAERMTGLVSEMSVYALAAYDAHLAKPLTQRLRGARPRYVLPSTLSEDQGNTVLLGSKRSQKKSGIDLKITYAEGDDPHRYVQVKTAATQNGEFSYDSRVTVVSLSELMANPASSPMTLARTVSNDALGRNQNRKAHQQLNTASQRLNRLIQ